MEGDNRVKVVIAGGGVAALEAALALRVLAKDRISVELFAPEPRFWYRPLAVAQPFKLAEARYFELPLLAAEAGATFSPGELVSVDATHHLAYTSAGTVVRFAKLLIACGAVPKPAVKGARTFGGPADTAKIEQLLTEIETRDVRRVAFAVPAGAVWSLPAYELALMTAAWLASRHIAGVELALVTPEDEPLNLFGEEASDAVRALLDKHEIAVHTGAYPAEARKGELVLLAGSTIATDRVIALPRLHGPRIAGIPQSFEGFIRVDLHGHVTGVSDVYAAGDITTFLVKQGGIAAQQADAAAEAIAAEAGVDVTPTPFRPVLRGLLLTGEEPRYVHGELVGGAGKTSQVSLEPLWWPPAKIVGRHLAPFLAGLESVAGPTEPALASGLPVELELEARTAGHRRDLLLEAVVDKALGESAVGRIGDVMSRDPLIVAPEDTLGEVAAKMLERDVGCALVTEHGRLIGIIASRDGFPGDARVRRWMTVEPIAASAKTTLEAAGILMAENNVHQLPVVEGERPVGIVAMREIIRAVMPLGRKVGLG
jgi:sulfide:quinone oxidoreductase